MRIGKFLASASVVVMVAAFAPQAFAAVTFDFETQNIGTGAYHYAAGFTQFSSDGGAASSPGVTFSGMSGIQNQPSAWGFIPTPNPVQTAFLQTYQNYAPGSISLDLTGITGHQQLTFLSVNRPGYGINPFTVTYGTNLLGTFTATDSWAVTPLDFVADGTSSLVFAATVPSGGDYDVGLDNVTITAVPEPATWAMLLLGFFGTGFMMRGARRKVALAAA